MTQETAERPELTHPDDAAFDEVPSERERVFVATPGQLMWWRFRRHKMALLSSVVLILLYLAALTWEFLAPYDPLRHDVQSAYAPPQRLQFFDEEGFHFPPFVYGLKGGRDPETFRKIFEVDESVKHPIKFMVHGDPYKFWGLMETDLHLFGLESNEGTVFLLGADRLGRDVLSRLLAATRISVSIGLVGVILSFVLGVLIGGISGYYGGTADILIQRIIEFIRAMPSIPLWLALSAAIPKDWPVTRVYFAITIILSLIGWTGLARVVRGRFLVIAGGGLCAGGPLRGCVGRAHHPSPHDAIVSQPYNRLADAGCAGDDFERDQSQLPWPGHAAAGSQLGRAAAGGAELAGGGAGAVAAHPWVAGGDCGAGL